MLVLSRRLNEKILFPTFQAAVQVVAVKPGLVRLGIIAPADVPVVREELHNRHAEARTPAPAAPLAELVRKRIDVATGSLGLLHRQLRDGLYDDADRTCAEVIEDLRSLRARLTPPAPAARPSCRALLVEDDRNERELLAGFLRVSGVDVDTAGDGSDALDYLRAGRRPDVVLLDMGLPRCDGPTAVREIRRDPALRGLRIFAVTGHRPDEYAVPMGPSGIDRWFQKPLDPVTLLHEMQCQVGPPAR